MTLTHELNPGQKAALEKLESGQNIFLTGAAGTGKSFVIRHFLGENDAARAVLLATTGAAAVIINGRTFHSFFGLFAFQAGFEEMVETALTVRSVSDRLKGCDCIVIDEVSMLNSRIITAGEQIARRVRKVDKPWGGLQVIATGDFCQLPPVSTQQDWLEGFCEKGQKDWVFLSKIWEDSGFETVELTEIMRTTDSRYLDVLQTLRKGIRSEEVQSFLNERKMGYLIAEKADMPFIYSKKDDVRRKNAQRLEELQAPLEVFRAEYGGEERDIKKLKSHSPIDEVLELKKGALVLIRKNNFRDPPFYANGSLGHYVDCANGVLHIELKNGPVVQIEQTEYEYKNGDGKRTAWVRGYPVNLGWATTIHKSQGATMDELIVDMGNIWESGQAYVALSRVRGSSGLNVLNTSRGKICLDQAVKDFYSFQV